MADDGHEVAVPAKKIVAIKGAIGPGFQHATGCFMVSMHGLEALVQSAGALAGAPEGGEEEEDREGD